MQSLKMQDGDLVISEGELLLVDGEEELAQSCRIVLGTNQGEWYLNPDFGLDFGVFLQKPADEETMREAIRGALQQEPRIDTVADISFSIDRPHRTMTVSLTARAADGTEIREEANVNVG